MRGMSPHGCIMSMLSDMLILLIVCLGVSTFCSLLGWLLSFTPLAILAVFIGFSSGFAGMVIVGVHNLSLLVFSCLFGWVGEPVVLPSINIFCY